MGKKKGYSGALNGRTRGIGMKKGDIVLLSMGRKSPWSRQELTPNRPGIFPLKNQSWKENTHLVQLFVDDFPINTSFYSGFQIAIFD